MGESHRMHYAQEKISCSSNTEILNKTDRPSVVVVSDDKWMILAVMIHDYDGVCYPVSFARRA